MIQNGNLSGFKEETFGRKMDKIKNIRERIVSLLLVFCITFLLIDIKLWFFPWFRLNELISDNLLINLFLILIFYILIIVPLIMLFAIIIYGADPNKIEKSKIVNLLLGIIYLLLNLIKVIPKLDELKIIINKVRPNFINLISYISKKKLTL